MVGGHRFFISLLGKSPIFVGRVRELRSFFLFAIEMWLSSEGLIGWSVRTNCSAHS